MVKPFFGVYPARFVILGHRLTVLVVVTGLVRETYEQVSDPGERGDTHM